MGADVVAIMKALAYARHCGRDLYVLEKDDWDKVSGGGVASGWHSLFASLNSTDTRKDDTEPRYSWHGMRCDDYDHTSLDYAQWSELAREVFVPTSEMAELSATRLLRWLPANENYVAVHIRRGDKIDSPWAEVETPVTIEQLYLTAGKSANDRVKTLAVVADEQSSVEAVLRLNSEHSLFEKVVYDKRETRRSGFGYYQFIAPLSAEELRDEMITMFSVVSAMRSARVLVGARSSTLFSLAELLRPAELACSTVSLQDNDLYPMAYLFEGKADACARDSKVQ